MSIANVSIVGNLVKAPQQTQFSNGKIKTTMVVAVNTPIREKRGGDAADFYRVETWGKLAELVTTKLDKGNQITAHGRLLMDKWKDKDGLQRVTPTVSASEIAFPQRARAASASSPEDEASMILGRSSFESINNVVPIAARAEARDAAEPSNAEPPKCGPETDDDEEQECENPDHDEEDDDDEGGSGEPNSRERPAPMRHAAGAPG